jgi:hypothetical protein
VTTKAPTPVINNTNLKKNFDITKLFMIMDPEKKRILQKEIADYSKTIFNRIYDKVKIEDVAVKLHSEKMSKRNQQYRYPEIGYISYLIKLGIDKGDVGNPRMTTWEQLYNNYDFDVAYMAAYIIPDQILHHFFGTRSDVYVDNIIISDTNGDIIYKFIHQW